MTKATIGVQIEDKVKYSLCGGLGFIYHTGLLLAEYYNTDEKVKELIGLGHISTLGAKIRDDFSSGIHSKLINLAYFDFLKEKITLPMDYEFTEEATFKHETFTVDANYFAYHGQQYNYLYDSHLHTWYLCEFDRKTLTNMKYSLKELLTNTDYLRDYRNKHGKEDCRYHIDAQRKELNMSVERYLNKSLVEAGIKNYKIYTERDNKGNSAYGLYEVSEENSKKKRCIARSPYAYQLIMYMACYYKGNNHNLVTLRDSAVSYRHLLQVYVAKN